MNNAFLHICAQELVKGKNGDKELVDVYAFGMKSAFLMLINLATSLTIGMLLDMFVQSIVITAAFFSLRTYAGGYHAKSEKSCFVLSQSMHIVMLLIVEHVLHQPKWMLISLMAMGIGCTAILIVAPVESIKRNYDALENRVFRRRCLIRLLIHIAIVFIAYTFSLSMLLCSIAWSDLFIGITAVTGKLIYIRNQRKMQAQPA